MNGTEKDNAIDNTEFKPLFIVRLLQIRAFYFLIKKYINTHEREILEKFDEKSLWLARLQEVDEILAFDFIPFFMNLLYIQIRTILELYFNDVLELIFTENTNILKNSNKQYSTEEILLFDDTNSLRRYLAMKEIQKFNGKSSKDQIEFLKIFLNKENILTEYLITKFIEVSEIRNLLVHNEGYINEKFTKLVNNPKFDDKLSIDIDEEMLLDAIDSMISFISAIDKELCEKFSTIATGVITQASKLM